MWGVLRDLKLFNELRDISEGIQGIGSDFWGEAIAGVISASISGVIIFLISSRHAKKISEEESAKNLEEMNARIDREASKNLEMKRKFYLEQVELDDYITAEETLVVLQKHVGDIYNKARMNDTFFSLPLSEKTKEAEIYFNDFQSSERIIKHIFRLYIFSEEEKGMINSYIGMVHSLINEIMKPESIRSFTHETYMEYFSEIEELVKIVRDKRYELYNKMKIG